MVSSPAGDRYFRIETKGQVQLISLAPVSKDGTTCRGRRIERMMSHCEYYLVGTDRQAELSQ